MRITLQDGPLNRLLVVADDGRSLLVQTDWDYPGVASTFGWSIRAVQQAHVRCDHRGTDGTVKCPACGLTAADFITDARAFLDDNIGVTADDPGYFD
jgi:hypothetical protein